MLTLELNVLKREVAMESRLCYVHFKIARSLVGGLFGVYVNILSVYWSQVLVNRS